MKIFQFPKNFGTIYCLLGLLLIPFIAQAASFNEAMGDIGKFFFGFGMNLGKGASVLWIISNVISGLFALLGLLAILFLIVGGVRYVASFGNPDQTQQAKNTITYAIIGVAIAISAYTIVKLVTQALFKG